MPQVTVIDYGIGNLLSVKRAFEYCGASVLISSEPGHIEKADRLVLPGVGAFADGMQGLINLGLCEPMHNFARRERPLLGICLGMQMLMDESFEFGQHPGLGLVAGQVVLIPDQDAEGNYHKIPHIGWNRLFCSPDATNSWEHTILDGLGMEAKVYFVHSYAAHPENSCNYLAGTEYGGLNICAAIRSKNIYGCQFHPEKSGETGLKIINNFMLL